MDSISEAQKDMRSAYYGGASGAFISATAWLAAAIVATVKNPTAGILTLIFAGMFIFPVSLLLCKMMGRSGKHHKNNPLAPLANQGTFWMLMSIAIAFGLSLHEPKWFFPAMLLTIAGRYLTFSTLYGMKIYLFFGSVLAIAAVPLAILGAPVSYGAYAGAIIESIFAILIVGKSKESSK